MVVVDVRNLAALCLLGAAPLGCAADGGDETGPASTTGTETDPGDSDDDGNTSGGSNSMTAPDDDDGSSAPSASGPTSASTTGTNPTTATGDSGETSDSDDTTTTPGPAGSCGAGGGTGEILQIELGSPDRWYLVGAHDTDEPLPLILAFHGDEGDPFMSTRYIWGSYWEQEQPPFITVMTKCPGCTSWYQGDTSANADYVWEVLADVAANYNVDVSRIYAVGYSGGSEFLAIHGWEFQDVFAGIQWSCGGNAYTPYSPPSRPDCKVHGRIVISQDDFLYDGAQQLLARLQNEGHEHEYVDAQCSGHCCDTPDRNVGAWEWFQTITKCDGIVPNMCGELEALPPTASRREPDSRLRGREPLPGRTERVAIAPSPQDFDAGLTRFDTVIERLESQAATNVADRIVSTQVLLREAISAYDTMLAAAHAHGPGAKEALTLRYPRLRAVMANLRE